MHETIQARWAEFSEIAIEAEVATFQISELKRVFYAGAFASLMNVMEATEMEVEEAAECMEATFQELTHFLEDSHGFPNNVGERREH